MFFPVAAHELHNTDIALSELHPAEADRLLNNVCSATGEHIAIPGGGTILEPKTVKRRSHSSRGQVCGRAVVA